MPSCVKFERSSHGTIGCTIGLAPHVYVGAFGASAADALSKAGELAAGLQALVNEHPELQQAISLVPGGTAAFTAISTAAKLLDSGGSLKEVAHRIGPVAAKVVHGILSLF
jgi:hypothetical protein